MTALIAVAAALPAAVSAGIVWATVSRWRRKAARLAARLREVFADLGQDRNAALDEMMRRVSSEADAALDELLHHGRGAGEAP